MKLLVMEYEARVLLGKYMSFLDDSRTPNVFGWAFWFVLGKPAGCHAHSSHLQSTSPLPPLPTMPCSAPALHLLSTCHPPHATHPATALHSSCTHHATGHATCHAPLMPP